MGYSGHLANAQLRTMLPIWTSMTADELREPAKSPPALPRNGCWATSWQAAASLVVPCSEALDDPPCPPNRSALPTNLIRITRWWTFEILPENASAPARVSGGYGHGCSVKRKKHNDSSSSTIMLVCFRPSVYGTTHYLMRMHALFLRFQISLLSSENKVPRCVVGSCASSVMNARASLHRRL